MTDETEKLKHEITALRRAHRKAPTPGQGVAGYNVAVTILTDLLGSIFIGCAIGLFLQYVFKTSVLLTAGLTLLGGVSGLYTTARYAMRLEKKDKL